MYQAFQIPAVRARCGKDLLHVDFLDADEGKAFVLHPERVGVLQQLEVALLRAPLNVEDSEAEDRFTKEQLRRYHELELVEAERLEREAVARTDTAVPSNVQVWWPSTRLTFIKKKIESLAPGEMFAVQVVDGATYAMTRQQFEDTFSNVVGSISYSVYGSYNYSTTPQKAAAFVVR